MNRYERRQESKLKVFGSNSCVISCTFEHFCRTWIRLSNIFEIGRELSLIQQVDIWILKQSLLAWRHTQDSPRNTPISRFNFPRLSSEDLLRPLVQSEGFISPFRGCKLSIFSPANLISLLKYFLEINIAKCNIEGLIYNRWCMWFKFWAGSLLQGCWLCN